MHGRQRRNQGVNLQARNDKPVHQAAQHAEQQPGQHADPQAFGHVDHHGSGDACTGNHRGDRQVKITGGQAEQHSAGHHAGHGDSQPQPLHIDERGEVRHKNRAGDEEGSKDHQHAVLVPDAAKTESRLRRSGCSNRGHH